MRDFKSETGESSSSEVCIVDGDDTGKKNVDDTEKVNIYSDEDHVEGVADSNKNGNVSD